MNGSFIREPSLSLKEQFSRSSEADHRQYNYQQLRESVQAVSVRPIAPDFSDQGQKDRDGQNAAQGVTEKLLRSQPERAARQFLKFRVVPSCTGK